ncbi:MAG: response regulator, partial [Deltaproteobacteria bacterium]|nr:response regulator [Candidatus Zymogenus saltonus]
NNKKETYSDYERPVRVLYFEDNEALAYLIQKKLAVKGLIVDIARDGKGGLVMYRKGSYDVIVVDYQMPIHNGLEVVNILLSEGELPPTIMVTGEGNEKLAVEAMKSGVGDYIVKDLEGRYIALLPSVIDRVLRQRQLIDEKRRIEEEKEKLIEELKEALEKVKTLKGLLPICSHCKKIRDDKGYWEKIEVYIKNHTEVDFTHGICPECMEKKFPQYLNNSKNDKDGK